MSAGAERAGRDWPRRPTRLPAIVDDIGVAIIEHGERGRALDPEHPEACLCGEYEPYYWCPGPGVGDLTISLDDDGRLHAEW